MDVLKFLAFAASLIIVFFFAHFLGYCKGAMAVIYRAYDELSEEGKENVKERLYSRESGSTDCK